MILHSSVPPLYGGIPRILLQFFQLACTLEDKVSTGSAYHVITINKVVENGVARVHAEGENKALYVDFSLQNVREKELFAEVIEEICHQGRWKKCGVGPDGGILFKASRNPSNLVTTTIGGITYHIC